MPAPMSTCLGAGTEEGIGQDSKRGLLNAVATLLTTWRSTPTIRIRFMSPPMGEACSGAQITEEPGLRLTLALPLNRTLELSLLIPRIQRQSTSAHFME